MGEKLIRYYEYVGEELGVGGKVELAQMTKLPSRRASTVPDSEEHLERFREAVAELTGEEPPQF